jgi:hypothetical protein
MLALFDIAAEQQLQQLVAADIGGRQIGEIGMLQRGTREVGQRRQGKIVTQPVLLCIQHDRQLLTPARLFVRFRLQRGGLQRYPVGQFGVDALAPGLAGQQIERPVRAVGADVVAQIDRICPPIDFGGPQKGFIRNSAVSEYRPLFPFFR